MSDARLKREAREYAVQQNINILRNRVNQLGVAEPVVQRYQVLTVSLFDGQVFRTLRVRKILGCDGNAGIPSRTRDQAAAASGRDR